MNARARTIAIGDVHGCLDELEELLARVSYRSEEDRLVFVGDLVDRGPNPAGVVRRVKELASRGDVVLVQGNHEEKLLRWHRRVSAERAGGPKNQMRAPAPERLAQWEALDDSERAWLEAWPPFASPAPGWLVVHAGFDVPVHRVGSVMTICDHTRIGIDLEIAA